MKLSQQKAERLDAFLASLSQSAVRELLKIIEMSEREGPGLNGDNIIAEKLRAVLQNDQNTSDKANLALKYLTFPLEDLLHDKALDVKQSGRIARSSLDQVWVWLKRDLIADDMPGLVDAIETTSANADEAGLLSAIDDFYVAIIEALQTALKDIDPKSSAYMELAGHIGGIIVMEDACEILQCLKLVDQIAKMRANLPEKLESLDETNLGTCVDLYDDFDKETDGFGWLVLLAIMRRLKAPSEVFWLITKIVGSGSQANIEVHNANIAIECALYDMEVAARTSADLIKNQRDIETIIEGIKGFYAIANELSSRLDINLKGVWGNRLVQVRSLLGDVIREQISDVPRRVKTAMFCGLGSASDAASKSPLTKGPDEEDVKAAEFSVLLLMGIRPFLSQLPVNAEYAGINTQVLQFVEHIGDATIERFRQAERQEKQAIEAYLHVNIDFTEIVFGEEAANLMRRQSNMMDDAGIDGEPAISA